jgi:putative N-acetylmannosamine-6-phosphate epimerase
LCVLFLSGLIVAGNVVNFDQIKELKQNGVWAFTIGSAIVEKKFVKDKTNREQILAVLKSL